jgi:hypothetical protein
MKIILIKDNPDVLEAIRKLCLDNHWHFDTDPSYAEVMAIASDIDTEWEASVNDDWETSQEC